MLCGSYLQAECSYVGMQIARVVRGTEVRNPFGRPGGPYGRHHREHQHPTGPHDLRAHAQQAARNDVTNHVHRADNVYASEQVFSVCDVTPTVQIYIIQDNCKPK
jgi:hypothetical protein